MTVWKKRLMSIERNERPFIDLLFFQKLMSFLKARMSKSVCKQETTAVRASSVGDVSVILPAVGLERGTGEAKGIGYRVQGTWYRVQEGFPPWGSSAGLVRPRSEQGERRAPAS